MINHRKINAQVKKLRKKGRVSRYWLAKSSDNIELPKTPQENIDESKVESEKMKDLEKKESYQDSISY